MPSCGICGGDGYLDGELCSSCFGTGATEPTGILPHLIKKIINLQNKCIDIMDKCNDIKEKCDEIKAKVDTL